MDRFHAKPIRSMGETRRRATGYRARLKDKNRINVGWYKDRYIRQHLIRLMATIKPAMEDAEVLGAIGEERSPAQGGTIAELKTCTRCGEEKAEWCPCIRGRRGPDCLQIFN